MLSDMTKAFADEERTALRLYCRTCDEILESRFVNDIPKQDHTIRFRKRPDGTRDNYIPVYDRDDFRSFMVIFRKLVMKKEPTHIYRILNLLSQHVTEAEHTEIEKIRTNLRSMESQSISFNLGTEEKPDLYSVWDACRVIFNAELFHSDPEKQEALEKLRSFGPLLQGFLVKFVTDFSRQAILIAGVIKHRGYCN